MVCLPDFNSLYSIGVLLDVDVDRKVSIDVSHLVLVTLGHASDQVVDDRLDGSEGSDVLSRAMVDFDSDCLQSLLGLLLGQGECYGDVREIFCEFACTTTLSA